MRSKARGFAWGASLEVWAVLGFNCVSWWYDFLFYPMIIYFLLEFFDVSGSVLALRVRKVLEFSDAFSGLELAACPACLGLCAEPRWGSLPSGLEGSNRRESEAAWEKQKLHPSRSPSSKSFFDHDLRSPDHPPTPPNAPMDGHRTFRSGKSRLWPGVLSS